MTRLAYCQPLRSGPPLRRPSQGLSGNEQRTAGVRGQEKVMSRVIQFVVNLGDRQEGQTLTEYAVIISLISVASIAFLTPLSDALNSLYDTVTNAF